MTLPETSPQHNFPQHNLMSRLVEQATAAPDAIALISGPQTYTYRQVNERSNQIARALGARGVVSGTLVGICMPRSAEAIFAICGVIKAGGAYLPIAPDYPDARKRFMATDAKLPLLLTDRSDRCAALADAVPQILAMEDDGWQQPYESTDLVVPVGEDALFHVLYTSGSTGNPKGVCGSHSQTRHRLHWFVEAFPLGDQEVWCNKSTLHFADASVEIFGALFYGLPLVILTEEVAIDPDAMVQLLAEHKVTRLLLVVSHLRMLLLAQPQLGRQLPLLNLWVVNGEPLTRQLVRQFYAAAPQAQLVNLYGSTEVPDISFIAVPAEDDPDAGDVPIGYPVPDSTVYIVDESLQQVPDGDVGELVVSGPGMALEYLQRPADSAARFVANPFSGRGRIYRTGDRAFQAPDGLLHYVGRLDNLVKIRGFRVELGEVESVLARHEAVRECAVMTYEMAGQTHLAGYFTRNETGSLANPAPALRAFLEETVPEHMVPSRLIPLESMPLTPSGKLDRRSLPKPTQTRPSLSTPLVRPKTATEKRLAELWQTHLGLDSIGTRDNFFELGGTSLLLTQLLVALREALEVQLQVVTLFQYPTIQTLSQHIDEHHTGVHHHMGVHRETGDDNGIRTVAATSTTGPRRRQMHANGDIAILSMAGRFPGAENIDQLWKNLCGGVESVTFFDDEQLEQKSPTLTDNPQYVKAGAVLEDIEHFDAAFFGYSPKEAAVMDPQQRILLECAWETFERAGYDPETYGRPIGVFAGCGLSSYLLNNISANLGIDADHPFIEADMAQFLAQLGNDRGYLATRISYKLNLTGPSVNVQTACSTSLVAVHIACQSLLSGECDMALAGGVSVVVPQKGGYLYEEGMVRSPDGHCRAFDAQAQGTIFGNGGGLVLLKRLRDALDDNDSIVAIIKGTSINNDGAHKVGYTAPSVERQAAVISEALAAGDVDAATIGYVEAHGTGTRLGDPIEVAGLTQAFQRSTQGDRLHSQYCAIGSIKTNIGHLDEAAGIAGLIKAALAVHHGQIPPSLHFVDPNPQIDFEQTPFFVNTELRTWPQTATPRRAGVSSFGVGGTNSHVVLEEAPQRTRRSSATVADRDHHILTLSAPNQTALRELAQRYVDHIEAQPGLELGDLCYTTNAGHKHFDHRLAVVAKSSEKVISQLRRAIQASKEPKEALANQTIAFLFTGHGGQYMDMGRRLYLTEPCFRDLIDQCDAIIRAGAYLDRSLTEILYGEPRPTNDEESSGECLIDLFAYAQPAIFAVEYALSQLWISWGIVPDIVMGHSTGEYVAACVAGVFSLEDGLKLVCTRGRLMQSANPHSGMVAVNASESALMELIQTIDLPARDGETHQVAIAAINSPEMVVVSGRVTDLDRVCRALVAAEIKHERLPIPVAAHSPLMESVLSEYIPVTRQVSYAAPRYTLISNVTGDVATNELATPEYWCEHLVQPVRFAEGMRTVDRLGANVLIEIGPTPVLLGMGRRCLPEHSGLWLPSLRDKRDDWRQLLTSLAELYMRGIEIDWERVKSAYPRCRLPLPMYPFQRIRCWIDAQKDRQPSLTAGRRHTESAHSMHPLLGRRLALSRTREHYFQTVIYPDSPAWVSDHKVFGSVILPGVSYFEMALAAGNSLEPGKTAWLEDVTVTQALIVPQDGRVVQVVLSGDENSDTQFEILSQVDDENVWESHACGRIIFKDATAESEVIDLEALQERCAEAISPELLYQEELARQMDMGPLMRSVRQLWRTPRSFAVDSDACALARIELPAELMTESDRYQIHPVLLDAGLQIAAITYPEANKGRTYVPVGVEHMRIYGRPQTAFWCRARYRPPRKEAASSHQVQNSETISKAAAQTDAPPNHLVADIHLFDDDGRVFCIMEGVTSIHVRREAMLRTDAYMNDWLYQIAWQPREMGAPSETAGSWLLVTGSGTRGRDLAHYCQENGTPCALLETGTAFEEISNDHYRIDARSAEDWERVLHALDDVQKIVFFGSPAEMADVQAAAAAAQQMSGHVLCLTQALLHVYPVPPTLWLVTTAAQYLDQPVANDTAHSALGNVAQSALWGLGRVIMSEHPELKCVYLDIDANIPVQALSALLTMNAARQERDFDSLLAWRDGQVYAARLTRHQRRIREAAAIRQDGSYLITGGCGGIGLQIARWLVEQGAGELILTGRSEPTAEIRHILDKLEADGTQITVAQADVRDLEALADILAQRIHPLHGIVHAAGVLDDGILHHQTTERFAAVMDPKALGVCNLHQLSLEHSLDFFVLFSSVASLLGTAGQSGYAAANAFLDGFGFYRQQLGLPGTSINWGTWGEVGLTARLGLVEHLAQKGEGVISPQEGAEIFGKLLTETAAQIAVMPIDWARFLRHEGNADPFYERFAKVLQSNGSGLLPGHHADAMRIRRRLEEASSHERPILLENHVRELVADILGMEISDLPRDENIGFAALGMDSLMSIELRNRLRQSLECSLPTTFAFDYGTVEKSTAYLTETILTPMEEPDPAEAQSIGELVQTNTGDGGAPLATQIRGEEDSLEAVFAELSKQVEG